MWVACGDDGGALDPTDAGGIVPFDCEVRDAPAGGGKIPDEVLGVLEVHCYGCHGEPKLPAAPMSLLTWVDFQGCHFDGQRVPNYERMRIRINDEQTPMPPIRLPQLDDRQRGILNRWVQRGAPQAP